MTVGQVTPKRPSLPVRLLIPTLTPASFMPICPRQPTVVNTSAPGPSSGRRRASTTKSVALSCMSQVWPSIPAPAARPSGTTNAVQSSSVTEAGCGPEVAARTVSTKSVKPPTTTASAGVMPAADAMASISACSRGENVSWAGKQASASSSTAPRFSGPPLQSPSATSSTRSRAYWRISAAWARPWASPMASGDPAMSSCLIGGRRIPAEYPGCRAVVVQEELAALCTDGVRCAASSRWGVVSVGNWQRCARMACVVLPVPRRGRRTVAGCPPA